jgi:hypothetical protein
VPAIAVTRVSPFRAARIDFGPGRSTSSFHGDRLIAARSASTSAALLHRGILEAPQLISVRLLRRLSAFDQRVASREAIGRRSGRGEGHAEQDGEDGGAGNHGGSIRVQGIAAQAAAALALLSARRGGQRLSPPPASI